MGCRSVDNAQMDVLERELRQQEDYIYELENNVLTYAEKLRECRCSNNAAGTPGDAATVVAPQTKRRSLPEPTLADDPKPARATNKQSAIAAPELDEEPSAAGAPEAPDELPRPGDASPSGAEPGSAAPEEATPEPVDPEELDVPDLEIGPTSDARPLSQAPRLVAADRPSYAAGDAVATELTIPDPASFDAPPDDGSALLAAEGIPAESHGGAGEELQLTAAAPQELPAGATATSTARDGEATTLVVKRLLRSEATAGPAKSLLVVVEARDDSGAPVIASEQTSIMLLREDSPGSLQAVRRWDFTQNEAKQAWQESALGSGLHFELPLGDATLPAGELQAWARIVRSDGTKLLAKATIDAATMQSLDDALAEASQAEPARPATPRAGKVKQAGATSKSRSMKSAAAAISDAPTWRKASGPIGPVSQGFASTAGGGWSTTTLPAAPVRDEHVQTATATESAASWRRSVKR